MGPEVAVGIASVLAAIGGGAPGGDRTAAGFEERDILLRLAAPGDIVIFAVNDALTGEDIEVDGLEDMACRVTSNRRQIRFAKSGSRGTDSEDIGLPFRDDDRGDIRRDEIMTEADGATLPGHAKCAGAAFVEGVAKDVFVAIEHVDEPAIADTRDVTHLEGMGYFVDQVVSYEVTGIGRTATIRDKRLADIRTGERIERQAECIRYSLLPGGALHSVADGFRVGSDEPVVLLQRTGLERVKATAGHGQLAVVHGVVLRQVELIEEFDRGAELHIRVLTHDRLNRAKAVITDETVKAQLAFFVVVRVHARTFGAGAAGAFIAAERAVLSGLNSQVRQQPNGLILEASLNKLKLVVNRRIPEVDEPL